MALFDCHTKCARCREKGVSSDACVEKKPCSSCDGFSEEQKLQLSTPKYRVRKELQKKTDSPSHVNPPEVTVLGKVESKNVGRPYRPKYGKLCPVQCVRSGI